MKKFRFFLMMFLTAAVCAGFQSCSDDEEEESGMTFSDFYIECTNVSGGGLSSQECASLRASLNEDLIETVITGMTKSEAIDVFDQLMEGLARELSSLQPVEPLKITYELKTVTGQSVKRVTITIKNDGVSIS